MKPNIVTHRVISRERNGVRARALVDHSKLEYSQEQRITEPTNIILLISQKRRIRLWVSKMHLQAPVSRWLILIVVLAFGSVASSVVAISLLTAKSDFNISASPDTLPVKVGQGSNSGWSGGSQFTTVTARSLRNFTGIVTLQTVVPSGVSANLYGRNFSAEDKILLGTSGNLSLWIHAVSIGNYAVKIIATGGSLSHSIDLPIIVQNLTMTLNPPSITIARGSSGGVKVTLSSVNGLSGTLAMGYSSYCYDIYGQLRDCAFSGSISFAPSSLVISAGGTVTTTLTVTPTYTSAGRVVIAVFAYKGSSDWTFSTQLSIMIT